MEELHSDIVTVTDRDFGCRLDEHLEVFALIRADQPTILVWQVFADFGLHGSACTDESPGSINQQDRRSVDYNAVINASSV